MVEVIGLWIGIVLGIPAGAGIYIIFKAIRELKANKEE